MTEEIFGKLKGRIDLNACTPIYDPAHLGGIHLANVVGGKLLAGLEDEVRRCRTSMTRARDDYAGVKQKMSELYFGPADDKTQFLKVDNFPFMRALGYAYLEVVYNPLGALKGYSPLETLSSVGLHWYGPNEGISFHRDYSHDRNLIGIFTLLGAGKFSVASSREGRDAKSYLVEPGSLVLMRAPLDDSKEQRDLRPFHQIESLSDERASILFRTRVR